MRQAQVSIPVTEEQLEVTRKVVDTGRTVRVRKRVEEFAATVREPVSLERVDIERVPIGRVVEEPPRVRTEGDVIVVPVVEERLVTRKELVLIEEIRLTRRREETQTQAEIPLLRERVVVERFDPDTHQWIPEAEPLAPPQE